MRKPKPKSAAKREPRFSCGSQSLSHSVCVSLSLPLVRCCQFECATQAGSWRVSRGSHGTITWTLSTPLACAEDDPEPPVPGCQWQGFDLSGLARVDLHGVDEQREAYQYDLRVCGELDKAECRQKLPGTAACQEIIPSRQFYSTGQWPRDGAGVRWSFLRPDCAECGVQYRLSTTRPDCWASGQAEPYFSNVQFPCAEQQGQLRASQNGCELNYTLPTPRACKPATQTSFETPLPLLALE